MSSEQLHEPGDLLSEETKNMHRALVSLREELEAVDWYQQRAEACSDRELRAILAHNRDEEIEHAMMVLEWIRRHSSTFDGQISTYLNSSGPIARIEGTQHGAAPTPAGSAGACSAPTGSLGIGSLKAGV
jgi:ferritin-like protein